MRFTTIRTGDGHKAARVDGDELTLLEFANVGNLVASGTDWRERGSVDGEKVALADADLAPLVPAPEKIFCVGLNYADHAAEADLELPTHPTLFAKFARSLIGPDDELQLPAVSDAVDWEIEIGVVIGSEIRNADKTEAMKAIAGYTIVNDVSMRDWQLRTSQYLAGKTFERSTPVGPFLVTPDEIDPVAGLAMRLSVDGEVMQESSTNQLAIGIDSVVSYISQIITLVPGDLIATGTPAGVGAVRNPPRFLAPGNVMECMIEGLGTQTTRCVA